ncbi:hypothetical protein [Streptomyces sp. NPDC054961]
MSLLDLRRSAKAAMVAMVAFAGLALVAAQPAAAATEGATGRECNWVCGKVTNSTDHGIAVTLEWGNSDEDRVRWERWVFPHSSMGGDFSGVDVDGVYVPGGCTAYGVLVVGPGMAPFAWGGGWHKISDPTNAVIHSISC